ncbi:MAG: glycosyltransferase [Saprospiraceae bacterium]
MKITILGTAYPYRGGMTAFNERLARQFISEGHEVMIHTFKLQYPSFLFPGKSQYSTEKAPKGIKIKRSINSINPINWIIKGFSIKKEKPDLLVIGYWLPLMGPAFGTILKLIKSNKHTKVISIVHNMIPHERRFGDKAFTSYFAKYVDGFLAMSQSVLNDIYKFDKIKPRVLSPHPVYDHFGNITSRDEAIKTLKLDAKYNYMLFFGLIRDYKGLDLLLNAFSSKDFDILPIRLIIAGEYYADKEKYIKIIKDNNLERRVVQVDKFIPDSEVSLYFNACDLVVQPYKTATQSGVTQIAYHFNKPMIVTDVGGLKEMCPNEKVGYVVPPYPKDIANAIIKFFINTNQKEMIENIKVEKQKYSWSEMSEKLTMLYSNIKEN